MADTDATLPADVLECVEGLEARFTAQGYHEWTIDYGHSHVLWHATRSPGDPERSEMIAFAPSYECDRKKLAVPERQAFDAAAAALSGLIEDRDGGEG